MKSLLILTMMFFSVFAKATAAQELECLGTEPFFGLKIDFENQEMSYAAPGEAKALISSIRTISQAQGMKSDMVTVIQSKNSETTATLIEKRIAGAACNDGMSDREYVYHLVLNLPNKVLYGCCNVRK